jgi:uncharacterized RDD family membrane protein YckC
MNDSVYILDEELLASNNKRFLNYVIDHVAFMIILMLIGFILGVMIALSQSPAISLWIASLGNWGWNLILLIISLIYYSVFEGIFGTTLGKLITGTVVVTENGVKPNFAVVVKRSLCRLIPFNAVSFFFNPGLGWHDSISDTYVVKKKALVESLKIHNDFQLIGIDN